MTSNALHERILYALRRPEAAESGRRLGALARELDEEREAVYEALGALCERGAVSLCPWPGGGRRGTFFAALEPPRGYGARTSLGLGSLGRKAKGRATQPVGGESS